VRRANGTARQWSSGGSINVAPSISEFDALVARLGLTEEQFADSAELKAFAKRYRNTKFIPEWLLDRWGYRVVLDRTA